MGLLAQEVEEVLAAHGLSNSGMVHQASEDAYRSVRYNDLLAPMIRAIQELDDAAESKDQQIASLEQRLQSQQEELLAVVQASKNRWQCNKSKSRSFNVWSSISLPRGDRGLLRTSL